MRNFLNLLTFVLKIASSPHCLLLSPSGMTLIKMLCFLHQFSLWLLFSLLFFISLSFHADFFFNLLFQDWLYIVILAAYIFNLQESFLILWFYLYHSTLFLFYDYDILLSFMISFTTMISFLSEDFILWLVGFFIGIDIFFHSHTLALLPLGSIFF